MSLPDTLHPRPRSFELRDGTGALAPLRSEVDASLPPQGFHLEISADGSLLRVADAAGRRYGESAIAALGRAGFDRAAVIDDGPSFRIRSYMLDVSRDRVPTRETLEWLVGILSTLRFNGLQLYVEHTFAYEGHEVVWRDASPLTPEDLRWLDGLCRDQGIELVSNMNGFGHMGRWLCHDDYRSRAECPDGFSNPFGEGTLRPTCLEPTEDNARFAVDLAREMLRAVESRRIHIGGDEPFELGDGRSAERVAARGRDRVYLEHLKRIIEPLTAEGCSVLFWADLFRRDPALMNDLPGGATGVVWNYERPSEHSWLGFLPDETLARLGMPDDAHLGFAAHARLFIESDTPFWVAPGTSAWNTLIGRNRNAAANLLDAAEVGARHAAEGYLVTDWGDNGHYQPLPVSLPSLVRAAGAAWCAETNSSPALDASVGLVIDDLLCAAPGLGARIDELGSISEGLGVSVPNGTAIFNACVSSNFGGSGTLDVRGYETARDVLADARGFFAGGPIPGERGSVLTSELSAVVGLAQIGLARLGAEHGRSVPAPSTDAIEDALARQRAAWLGSSRPGGLEDSLARFQP